MISYDPRIANYEPGFLDQVSQGKFGSKFIPVYISFFGLAVSSDNTFKTIWPAGDFSKPIISTPSVVEVTSTSTADVGQQITLEGLNALGNTITEVITLNGQTPVPTVNTYLTLFQAVNRGPGTLLGNVYFSPQGSAKTAGVPNSNTDVYEFMRADRNRTSSGFYRVPAGKRGILKRINASTGDGADVQLRVSANFQGNPPVSIYEPLLKSGNVGTPVELGFVLEPLVLIQLQAKGGTQKPDISGFCELYLIDA